ncbi:MAG: LytTR family DNA-binding domain-containing protein [Cellulophaga sp.]|uniref:LytR/AlgR family response regulator transcription factor n=1 Tax=unclassified Cellulophaga TaxID=2634405 RepID=UPI000C2BB97C|nr:MULTISPECIES: LytTR family DNA-binding domain-containing protein [unclassified Cellulophaga]MDO6490533.1 LytTR family DNA-binding domain-containing protein [Cellulophaga sp. 2_MG-2023]MDO6494273.1 LytTR family DNA-binding domain-containing protein [Cellulophaga sp. 3_MG-2023]PKB45202.1 LytTR family two component transcriptional regulator [Cellulophaga sp. RHA19]|eukprot:TRINITY_DN12752_c0_g1_i1.p1 TRINITY_DN12752_c0_g1~~TRINITY_DN12752_c0_g1_i1.p1  ORF type:complete len:250 (+),score=13.47 TRINITY_DN12752_c0_g1_i1:237-986(+)
MSMIKAVIVEDSRLARNELKELIKNQGEIEILGEAENVDEGYKLINETQPDLLFLDINMPEKDGFELLEMLDKVPITVFTTAFDEYAIKSFEYNALDYILKPINAKRFGKAIEKVKVQLEGSTAESSEENVTNETKEKLTESSQIFIKDGDKCWLVKIGDISLFEIVGNYTRVYFKGEKPMLYKSLNQVEEKLPDHNFFRVNRQQIINVNYIANVVPWFNGKLKLTMNSGEEVEVSRRQSYIFKDKMSI